MPYENKVLYVTSTIQKKKKKTTGYTYLTLPKICTIYVQFCVEFGLLKVLRVLSDCGFCCMFLHSVIPSLLHWKIFVFKEYISKQKEANNFYKYL